MKSLSNWGICLILCGVLVLAVGFFAHHTTNLLLSTGLILIIGGTVAYIQGIKRGKY